jgi:glycosyltransferase involved in cell wall biosynthesis
VCVSKAVTKVFDGVVENDEKISVIYDGVNVDYLAQQTNRGILHTEFGLSADTLIIGNIAALKPEKDLITFIDAAALALRYSHKKLCFMVVGEGPMKEQLVRYAQQKGISDKLIFCGFRQDMAQILPEFSCLMMSSKSEGLPLSIFEAFACKVPVVTTAAGGIGEVIQQEHSGMISPIGDSLALARNLLTLLNNHELRNQITTNAFGLVRENFSLDVMRNNYYELYKSIAQQDL